MKNNFFVFIEIVFVLLFLLLCGIGSFIFAIFYGLLDENIFLIIFLTFMLVVLPVVLFIFCICVCAAKIFIDETGITKRLFGVKLKYYKWDEIDHIKYYGNPAYVTSISLYKKRGENKMFSCFYKYERIFFSCSNKKLSILKRYAPESIKQKLERNSTSH